MAADYQKLAANVDAAAANLEKSAASAEAQAEALDKARQAVDRLEESLFSLDAQAAKLSQEQAELTRRVAEAANRRDAYRDLVAATGGAQGGAQLKEASAELAALEKELDRTAVKLGMLGERSQQAAQALDQGREAELKQQNRLAQAQAQQQAAGQALEGAQAAKKDAAAPSLGGGLEAVKGATDALMSSFNSLAGLATSFVGALNPGLVEQFSMAMRDVTAVIGQALEPVLVVLTGIVREVGAVLNPVMRQLAPVVQQVARAMSSLLVPIIENAAAVIQTLVPAVQVLADVVTALTPIFRAMSVVQAGLVEVFKDLIGGLFGGVDMKSVTDSFKSAMEETAKVLIKSAAHIARAFGALNFIDGMIKGIERKTAKKETSEGMAAPQNVGITDVAGYGSQVMTAAFAATGNLGDEGKKTEEWLKDIAGDLKGIKDGPSKIVEEIKAYFDPILEVAKLVRSKLDRAGVTYDAAKGAAERLRNTWAATPYRWGEALGRELFGGG